MFTSSHFAVVQQPPEEVKIENMVVLSSDDTSLVSLLG